MSVGADVTAALLGVESSLWVLKMRRSCQTPKKTTVRQSTGLGYLAVSRSAHCRTDRTELKVASDVSEWPNMLMNSCTTLSFWSWKHINNTAATNNFGTTAQTGQHSELIGK